MSDKFGQRGGAVESNHQEAPELRLAGGPSVDRPSAHEIDLAESSLRDPLGTAQAAKTVQEDWGRGRESTPQAERFGVEHYLGPVSALASMKIEERMRELGLPPDKIGSLRLAA